MNITERFKYIIKHTKRGRVSRVEERDSNGFLLKTLMGNKAICFANVMKLEPSHEYVQGTQHERRR